MVSNPLYGPRPDVDVAQLRALRLFPPGEWRGPGCGDRCVRVFAELMGGEQREIIEAHDPAAHEAHVHALYRPRLVRTGCLTVDTRTQRYWVDGQEMASYGALNRRLIVALAKHVGCVVPRNELWVALHGPDVEPSYSGSYWSTRMGRVREALGRAADLIEHRLSFGYVLKLEEP